MTNTFLVSVSDVINATPAQVWDALTDPAKVKKYFFGVDVITDWKEGSPITYKGVWEGKEFTEKGNVIKVEPEKLLHTNYWSPSYGKPDVPENYQNVWYKLEPVEGGTKLTIEQDNNASAEARDHSASNWNMILGELKKMVEA